MPSRPDQTCSSLGSAAPAVPGARPSGSVAVSLSSWIFRRWAFFLCRGSRCFCVWAEGMSWECCFRLLGSFPAASGRRHPITSCSILPVLIKTPFALTTDLLGRHGLEGVEAPGEGGRPRCLHSDHSPHNILLVHLEFPPVPTG